MVTRDQSLTCSSRRGLRCARGDICRQQLARCSHRRLPDHRGCWSRGQSYSWCRGLRCSLVDTCRWRYYGWRHYTEYYEYFQRLKPSRGSAVGVDTAGVGGAGLQSALRERVTSVVWPTLADRSLTTGTAVSIDTTGTLLAGVQVTLAKRI